MMHSQTKIKFIWQMLQKGQIFGDESEKIKWRLLQNVQEILTVSLCRINGWFDLNMWTNNMAAAEIYIWVSVSRNVNEPLQSAATVCEQMRLFTT